MFSIFVINNQVESFLEIQYTAINNKNTINNNKKYSSNYGILRLSNATKIKLKQICDKYCKSTNIVVAFSPLKTGSLFSIVKTLSLGFFNPMLCTSLLVQAVMLVTLAKTSAT